MPQCNPITRRPLGEARDNVCGMFISSSAEMEICTPA